EPETPTLQTDAEGLTTSPQLCQISIVSRAPASQATSFRIAGRHHLGISGRHRRNPHSVISDSLPTCARAPPTSAIVKESAEMGNKRFILSVRRSTWGIGYLAKFV